MSTITTIAMMRPVDMTSSFPRGWERAYPRRWRENGRSAFEGAVDVGPQPRANPLRDAPHHTGAAADSLKTSSPSAL